MGKAIVIPGLVVTNPVAVVTFEGVEGILAAYYQSNVSISASEKTALEAFVEGLIDVDLWRKMKYFYPMLGNSVDDLLLDVVNPTTDDLLSRSSYKGSCSVDNRVLKVTGDGQVPSPPYTSLNASSRFAQSLDMKDMSMIVSCTEGNVSYGFSNVLKSYPSSGDKYMIGLGRYSDGKRPSYMYAGIVSGNSVVVPSTFSEENSYTERILCADYDSSNCTLYKDKTISGTGANNATNQELYKVQTFISPDNDWAKYNFFAITEHLTQSQWNSFYDLLLLFVKAVGKHS